MSEFWHGFFAGLISLEALMLLSILAVHAVKKKSSFVNTRFVNDRAYLVLKPLSIHGSTFKPGEKIWLPPAYAVAQEFQNRVVELYRGGSP